MRCRILRPRRELNADDQAIADLAQRTIAEFHAQFEQFQFSRALETAWALVSAVNKYIVDNEPWAIAEKPGQDARARLATVLYTSAEVLRIVTALSHPIIPESTARIWQQLGLGDISKLDLRELKWGQLQLGTKLGTVEPVFPRADKGMAERMQQMELEGSAESEKATELTGTTPQAAEPAARRVASRARPAIRSRKQPLLINRLRRTTRSQSTTSSRWSCGSAR